MLDKYRLQLSDPVLYKSVEKYRLHAIESDEVEPVFVTLRTLLAETPEGLNTYDALNSLALTAGDVVAILAKCTTYAAANQIERLAARPVRLLPAARSNPMLHALTDAVQSSLSTDPRIIRSIVPNPFRKGTKRWHRFSQLHEGITAGEAHAKGVLHRDVAKWARLKYIQLWFADGRPAPVSFSTYLGKLENADLNTAESDTDADQGEGEAFEGAGDAPR